jgi:hypothetical protein
VEKKWHLIDAEGLVVGRVADLVVFISAFMGQTSLSKTNRAARQGAAQMRRANDTGRRASQAKGRFSRVVL